MICLQEEEQRAARDVVQRDAHRVVDANLKALEGQEKHR
jgi:hypothetical protein